MNAYNNKLNYTKLTPVMLAFFTMGFVDLVGIATNYVKVDFDLSDSMANLLPSMVFFWFLIFSVPTGMLMNRVGRRKTLVVSSVITVLSLLLPFIDYNYAIMLVSFALLGIGNTLMQVSINPLVSNLIRGERLASAMTFGQFVKAIASFMAPIIAAWTSLQFDDWRILFPIFMVVAIITTLWLSLTKIEEEKIVGKPSTFKQCFSLLRDGFVFMSFLGIICHVGIDVGTNVTVPKILMERLGMDLSAAGYATSVYFLFRTIGALTGSIILAKFSAKKFFLASVAMLTIGIIGLTFVSNKLLIYVFVGLIGYGNSNVFSIVFSQALFHKPGKKNEISGLMIMGLFGGTIFTLTMGMVSDAMASQIGAVFVMLVGAIYLLSFINKVRY